MRKLFIISILISLLGFSLNVSAQSDGGVDGGGSLADPGGSTTPPPLDPKPLEPTPAPDPIIPTPNPTPAPTPKPVPVSAPVPLPVIPDPTPEPVPQESSHFGLILGAIITLGLGSAIFAKLQGKNKKEEEKEYDKKCLNFKKMMEDKLNELTDIKGKIESFRNKEAIRAVKDVVSVDVANLINLAEEGKKEYDRLKTLYEKCMISFGQKTNLLFLWKPEENKVLLAMKKRRFGEGKWNGVGGKTEENETVIDSLAREVKEEIGVKINKGKLIDAGTIDFQFKDNPDWNNKCHVFLLREWEGEPIETEEMAPKWFNINEIPWESMWVDDKHWLPKVLSGKKIEASFTFNKDGKEIIEMEVDEKN